MRISVVRIQNFRCLEDVEVKFDQITTFVGPNGAGKSSVLRAMDWFFNADSAAALDVDDVYAGAAPDGRIQVQVTFDDLSNSDRDALGPKYAPASAATFTVTRTWQAGIDKTTGRGKVFPDFIPLRKIVDKMQLRAGFNEYREAHPEMNLAKGTAAPQIESEMRLWESQNASLLVDHELDDTHFFGFNGKNVLSGLFDFVLVTADLRANEQSHDGRKTVLGLILEKAIDQSLADAAFSDLAEEVTLRQAAIHKSHYSEDLDKIAEKLSAEVLRFTSGRSVGLRADMPSLKPSRPSISVFVNDVGVTTSVDRQGHGFQRALLIGALKLLAERDPSGGQGVLALAIEEPELFQHPTQARIFARVLRQLASASGGSMQVAYATHSPYFVNAAHFGEIRRVCRTGLSSAKYPHVEIYSATMPEVTRRLDGNTPSERVLSRWAAVFTPGLNEAFFAEGVIFVEGVSDKAVFDGIRSRDDQGVLGILDIAVVDGDGKDGATLPLAILEGLRIPTIFVFDNDSNKLTRMEGSEKHREKSSDEMSAMLRRERANIVTKHHELLRFFGLPEQDFPVGPLGAVGFAMEGNLEDVLEKEWSALPEKCDELIAAHLGSPKKNAATYEMAARICAGPPGQTFVDVFDLIAAQMTTAAG